jgi:D-sedoheptulose 7-phosphate isomerase
MTGAPNVPLDDAAATSDEVQRHGRQHVVRLAEALLCSEAEWATAADWGRRLVPTLSAGGRLLVAGNGGSAAQAQHLSAEFVGRYGPDRRPFSSIALHADTSAVTAIANDYGVDEMFARQVEAHGRSGDVLLLLSTSGRSANMVAAARRARTVGVRVWAMTGPRPNPLADAADEALTIECGSSCTVQELHLVAVHLVCEAFDLAQGVPPLAPTERVGLRAVTR